MTSPSISWRSSSVKSDCVFCGLRMTATMTSSKCRAVRSMMSRWPMVTGSNEPGQRAVATRRLLLDSVSWSDRSRRRSRAYRRRPAPRRCPNCPAAPGDGVPVRPARRRRSRPARANPSAASDVERPSTSPAVAVVGRVESTRSNGASGGRRTREERRDRRCARPGPVAAGRVAARLPRIASTAATSWSTSTALRRAPRQRLDRRARRCPRRGRAPTRRRGRSAGRALRTAPPAPGRWSAGSARRAAPARCEPAGAPGDHRADLGPRPISS